jgi:hypothetical protein
MVQQNGAVLETQIGLVEAVNPQGIKVAGRWWNFSRYHDVARPEQGQQVALEAKSGFIQRLTVRVQAEPVERVERTDEEELEPSVVEGPAPLDELRMSRLAVLRAAASFLALRPDVTTADVLKVADRWVGWVLHDTKEQQAHEI